MSEQTLLPIVSEKSITARILEHLEDAAIEVYAGGRVTSAPLQVLIKAVKLLVVRVMENDKQKLLEGFTAHPKKEFIKAHLKRAKGLIRRAATYHSVGDLADGAKELLLAMEMMETMLEE